MKIKTKLILGGITIGLLLLATLVIARISFGNLNNGFGAIMEKAGSGVENAQIAESMIAESDESLTSLSGDMVQVAGDIAKTNQTVRVLERKIKTVSATLDELTASMEEAVGQMPEGEARYSLEDATDAVGDIKEIMRREALISLSTTMEKMNQFAQDIGTQKEGVTALSEKLGKVKELSAEVVTVNLDISSLSESFDEGINSSSLVITLFLLTVIVISLAAAGALTITITRPLEKVTEMAKDIAEGDGDLTKRLDDSRKDEVGELSHWLNTFVGGLQELIGEVQRSSVNYLSAVQEMSTTSQKSSDGIHHQQKQTEQVTSSLSELTNTVQNVANDSVQVEQAAIEADGHANEGAKVVNMTTDSINTLAGEVESSADVILQLGKQSDKIGTVLDVIKGIAEQTNLLALNAAIEAARAGEQGRGFAVVADEVRTLAGRTQQATQEIHEMIEFVQLGTEKAVRAMESGRARAHKSVQQADSARSALSEITSSVAGIKQLATQIVSATEKERMVTEQISQSMDVINGVANENDRLSKQTATNSEHLSSMASQLQELVGRFKV